MTAKIDNITDKSNVVYFKNYFDKQKLKTKTSTIAAIIALKIDHPDDINPEDFFIENIEIWKPKKYFWWWNEILKDKCRKSIIWK